MNLSITSKDIQNLILDLLIENKKLKKKAENKDNQLFHEYLSFWLTNHRLSIEQNTFSGYEYIFNNHILPYFKKLNIKILEVTPIIISKYYYDKIDKGLSNNSILKHHANIRKALNYAYKNNIIFENIADKLDIPKKTKFITNFYSIKELKNVLIHLPKKSRLYTPVLLAGYLGLRRSELLGLKWDCVNFESNTITIKRKNIYIQNKKITLTSNNLKTKSSYITLPIPTYISHHLK